MCGCRCRQQRRRHPYLRLRIRPFHPGPFSFLSQVPQAPLEVADTRHVRLRTSAAEAAAARRSQRRAAAGVRELMFVSDGDTNGAHAARHQECHLVLRYQKVLIR